MYIDSINIEKTKAASTYGKWSGGPIEVCSGSKKTRLNFSPGQNGYITDKTVTSVYVEKIGNGFFDYIKSLFLSIMDRKFVKCTYNKETIYINVNSLSKRIGIAPEKIHSSAKSENNLSSLIENSHQSYLSTQKKVDAHFRKIIQEKYTEEDHEIKTVDGKSLSKSSLYKMIGIAAFSGFSEKDNVEEVGYPLEKGRVLHLKKREDGEWPLLTLFTERVLGQGSFGSVQVVEELSMGRISVAKIAHNSSAEKDAKNEFTVLGTVFNKNDPVGIQQKPYALFNFNVEKRRWHYEGRTSYRGYVAPKYDSDLRRAMSGLKSEEKIECARQLLKGLVELEKQQICHGDIKEANCLFRRDINDSIECVIADFGGASSVQGRVKAPKYGTISYRSKSDDYSYSSLLSQYSFEKTQSENEEISSKAKRLLFRRDIYAMGIVLSNLLRSYRFENKEDSNNFNLIIKKMRMRSWKDRISASDALEDFDKIFPIRE